MILARCPACQTVFRVRPEQLRAHQGSVRCGHCYAPFNALDHLLEDVPAAAPAQPDSAAPTGTADTVQHAPRPAAPMEPTPADIGASAALSEPAARIEAETLHAEAARVEMPGSDAPPFEPPVAEAAAPAPAPAAVDTPAGKSPPPAAARPGTFFVLEEKTPADETDERTHFLPFEPADRWAAPRPAPSPADAAAPADTERAAPDEPPPGRRKASTFEDLADRLEFGLPDSFLMPARPGDTAASAPPPADSGGADTVPSLRTPTKTPDPWAAAAPPDFIDLDLPLSEPEPTVLVVPEDEREPQFDAALAAETIPGIAEDSSDAFEPGETASELEPRAPFIPEEAPPLEHLDAAYGRPSSGGAGRRWLWGLGIGILLGTLAVQAAYVFREEIARQWPQLRPLYLAVCEQLRCTMPLPRMAAAISIESSDLQSDPAEAGRFVLNAVVRNRATYVQALPHLELTLTDARDRPLVRRVFAPAEWVPHGELARGFRAEEELGVRLPFSAPGVEAAGYRVYVFYP